MAYSRPPVQAGRGLTRSPADPGQTQTGVFDYSLESDIASTTNLGIIQVGSGLSITPLGVLSTNNGNNNFVNVKLTDFSYTATATDLYVGATSKNITITLPKGILGRVYYVKNQVEGNIKVKGTGQNIDSSGDKTLGTDASIIVVFDGVRWNIIG